MLAGVFAGFPPEALAFYRGLEADNSKAYWTANRDRYEDAVREPLEELTYELQREFGASKLFRPYRDVRFAKDKTPYKTHQGAVARQDGHEVTARYVELSAAGLRVGAGAWEMSGEQLAKVRRAIDDGVHGRALERIKAEIEDQGLAYWAPELKTAPRGFPKDHERIELLRCKRHAAMATLGTGDWLHERTAMDRIVATWRACTPLVEWLERHAA
jgi:uncharacterized protein (TIGR02453 family)